MRALVTGSTGFIGSLLVDNLLDNGIEVRVVVRPTSNLKYLPEDRIEVMTGQLQDAEFLDAAVTGVDLIYHVAGTLVADSIEGFRSVNVRPTRLLLEAAARQDGFKRFLLVSSQGASGPSADGTPLTETSLPNPVSDYGRTKLEAEYVALDFKDKVPVTIVRPSAVFGPRDSNFLKIFKRLVSGMMPRFGKEERFSNLVYGPDLVEGIRLASLSDETLGKLYFMSNKEISSYDVMVAEMERALGVKAKRPTVPNAVLDAMALFARVNKKLTGRTGLLDEQRIATIKERFWTADVSKLENDLGWVPPTPLPEAMDKTVAWYREKGWV